MGVNGQGTTVRLRNPGDTAGLGESTTPIRVDPTGTTTQPVSGTITANPIFSTRADTYTATGNGVTIDVSTRPVQAYAVQVKGTGAAPTSWDVRLEGSLDNVNFTQILQHTQVTGDGVVVWSGASLSPSLYIRSRTAGLVLGTATNIVVTLLGTR